MNERADEVPFFEKVRAHYPEGLTGVISPGGTRLAYIMTSNRNIKNPGEINFADYTEKSFTLYCQLLVNFFELGGQNIIDAAPPLSLVLARSSEYINTMVKYYLTYISEPLQEGYKKMQIDPHFVGLEAIMHGNPSSTLHQYAQQLTDFMQRWPYSPQNRKLIFEVCPIPLYSLWNSFQNMSPADRNNLDAQLRADMEMGLNQVHLRLYNHFLRATYGFELPPPHFTLSTNVKGSCKAYLSIPSLFSSGINMKFFYTPYSPIYIKKEGLKKIFEDLIAPKQSVSNEMDYRNHNLSPKKMKTAYLDMKRLIDDPSAIIGLTK